MTTEATGQVPPAGLPPARMPTSIAATPVPNFSQRDSRRFSNFSAISPFQDRPRSDGLLLKSRCSTAIRNEWPHTGPKALHPLQENHNSATITRIGTNPLRALAIQRSRRASWNWRRPCPELPDFTHNRAVSVVLSGSSSTSPHLGLKCAHERRRRPRGTLRGRLPSVRKYIFPPRFGGRSWQPSRLLPVD
jgi:hypothetical protein